MLYHYTHLVAGGSIIEDGYLKVSEWEKKNGFKPTLWFSKHELYEPTALKQYQTENVGMSVFKTMQEQANKVGCVRFGYKGSDLHTWKEYGSLSEISRQERRRMEKSHKKQGANPSDWLCSFDDISLEDMSSVEIWTDKWEEWTDKSLESAMHKAEFLTMDGCEESCCSSK